MNENEVMINGEVYVKKSTIETSKETDKNYVIVRTTSAGVFAGYLQEKNGKEVVLSSARRLWYWEGAASLSQIAMSGVSKPDKCKFPEEMSLVTLTEAIEIIPCTKDGMESIKAVKIWKH